MVCPFGRRGTTLPCRLCSSPEYSRSVDLRIAHDVAIFVCGDGGRPSVTQESILSDGVGCTSVELNT